MRKNLFSVVAENLSVQHNSKLNAGLIEIFKSADAKKDTKESLAVCREISELIRRETGMNAMFMFDPIGPSALIADLTNAHIFEQTRFSEIQRNADIVAIIKKQGTLLQGGVDFKGGRVSGVYTNLSVEILFNQADISSMSPEECAAITLHEIGHAFTFFAYLNRTAITSQVLAAVATGLHRRTTVSERKDILDATSLALSLKDYIDPATLAEKEAPIGTLTLVASACRAKTLDMMFKDPLYNINVSEQLADQFAARHGAGLALAGALDKYNNRYKLPKIGNKSIDTTIKHIITVGLIYLIATTPVALGVTVAILVLGATCDDMLYYDDHKTRVTRIRNDMMEAIKDKSLSKDDLRLYVANMDNINDLLKDMSDGRSLFENITRKINSYSRKRAKQEELVSELESLVANDLYLSAAKLRLN